jgi:hypothetical protein
MSDEPKLPTDDQERLRRYLEWRERTERPAQRVVRRRRLRGALAGAAVALVGVAALAWVSYGSRHAAPTARRDAPSAEPTRAADGARVTEATDAPRAIDAGRASQPQSAPPETATSPAPAIRRRARASARIAAPNRLRAAPADESAAPSAAPSGGAPASDLVATVTTPEPMRNERSNSASAADTATPDTTPSTVLAPPRTDSPPAPSNPPVAQDAPAAPTAPVAQTPATVAPGTVTSIESKPDCDGIGGQSPDGRARGQRVADCVGGWLKGQTQELRDGVKRQADDFRAGIDRVGQGLQWLGGKLRRSE